MEVHGCFEAMCCVSLHGNVCFFLVALHTLNPEVASIMFLQNIGEFLQDDTM
jgi:hypothetical protein